MTERKRILIVEDELLVAQNIARKLQTAGYEIADIVVSGEEAAAGIAATRPNLILMDIGLAGQMSGVEAAAQIKAQWDIPIIYLTAYADEQTLERAKVTEPFGYIPKPFVAQELYSTIETALYKHEMERKLRESEARYRALVENVNDIIFAVDAAGIVTYINPVAERILGYAPAEINGRDFREFVYRQDLPDFEQALAKSLAGHLSSSEYRLRKKDGSLCWIRGSSQQMLTTGEVSGVQGILTDITARKGGERAIQQRLKSLTAPDLALESVRFEEFVDIGALQSLLDGFYEATGLPTAILNLEEEVLAAAGWQEICTCFHRVHSETAARCRESDAYIKQHLPAQGYVEYRCQNGLWDMAIPIRVHGKHVATFFFGQVFLAGEPPDWEFFRAQARRYDFDEAAYLAAVARVPVIARSRVRAIMNYYEQLVHLIVSMGLNNLSQARAIAAQKRAEAERERLLAAEHAQRELAETLIEIATALNSSLDRTEVLQRILDQLARVVSYDSVTMLLMNEDNSEIIAHRGFDHDEHPFLPPPFKMLPHVQEVLEQQHAVIISDTHTDTRWQRRQASESIRCWLGVPLIAQGQVIGILNLDKKQPHFYTPRDAEVATAFASQAALAIVNAQLYEQAQHEIAARKHITNMLQRRTAQLEALRHVGLEITTQLDLDALLHSIVAQAMSLLEGNAGSLSLYDANKELLEFVAHVGFVSLPEERVMQRGEGLVGKVWEFGRPLIVNNYQQWEGRSPRWEKHIATLNLLGVPVRWGAEFLGVLEVLAEPPRAFSYTDVELLSLFATQAAIAIRNARLYEQGQQYAQELARSNEDLAQFAYVVSHDLQEPLRMVVSYLQILEQSYQEHLDAEAGEAIYYAVDGATRMQKMIKSLLEYSRVNTRGKEFAPVDCAALLRRVLSNLKFELEDTNAVVTQTAMPVVLADAAQLERVFQNLLSNALKYHGAEPPRVHIAAEETDTSWVFFVRDNGIGIDAQHFAEIFVIFRRLHTREEYAGTGIGLAICKKIVERHGGRIWVESALGAGTTFYFTIPKK